MKMSSREIVAYAETAAHECARESVREWKATGLCIDKVMLEKINALKGKGVSDMTGALADDIFNDKGFLSDMIGDQVFDAGKDKIERLSIVSELKGMKNFEAWNEAMKELETTMI